MQPLFFLLFCVSANIFVVPSGNENNWVKPLDSNWRAILATSATAHNLPKNSSDTDLQRFADTVSKLTISPNFKITTLQPLVHFKALKKLYVTNNQAITDWKPLAYLVNIEQLELENCSINNLKPLRQAAHLRRLNIARTAVKSLQPLCGLANLEIVLCMETKIPRNKYGGINARCLPKECRVIRDYVN